MARTKKRPTTYTLTFLEILSIVVMCVLGLWFLWWVFATPTWVRTGILAGGFVIGMLMGVWTQHVIHTQEKSL